MGRNRRERGHVCLLSVGNCNGGTTCSGRCCLNRDGARRTRILKMGRLRGRAGAIYRQSPPAEEGLNGNCLAFYYVWKKVYRSKDASSLPAIPVVEMSFPKSEVCRAKYNDR